MDPEARKYEQDDGSILVEIKKNHFMDYQKRHNFGTNTLVMLSRMEGTLNAPMIPAYSEE